MYGEKVEVNVPRLFNPKLDINVSFLKDIFIRFQIMLNMLNSRVIIYFKMVWDSSALLLLNEKRSSD